MMLMAESDSDSRAAAAALLCCMVWFYDMLHVSCLLSA